MYHSSVTGKLLGFVREHGLIRPGDRVGVAVSGGADSVALLRLLLQTRQNLGVVLSVLHFNHKIRGTDAEQDQQFVAALAAQYGLDFHTSTVDVPAYAAEHKLSLEAAGREARYAFFESFFHTQVLEVVATGHTLDDQAETVLMRVLRAAGTKGLAGIFPAKHVEGGGTIVRPLLCTRRAELRNYLQEINQAWHEDATNVDLQYTRNRIRHGLIPLIETRFQPNVVLALAQLAEVAREEECYWQAEVSRVLAAVVRQASSSDIAVNLPALLAFPPALQRRILRECAQRLRIAMGFEHLERLLRLARSQSGRLCELPGGWTVTHNGQELSFASRGPKTVEPGDYQYRLPIPGEIEVREIGRVIRAFLRPVAPGSSGYNREQGLDPAAIGRELVVRNWRPGDRFWPAHSKGPAKIKELLQERHVTGTERHFWPVAVAGEKLAWSRGLGASAEFHAAGGSKEVVVIEEHVAGSHE